MDAVILDAGSPAECHPLTCTRTLAACPVANQPLLAAQRENLRQGGCQIGPAAPPEGPVLYQRGDAWLSVEDVLALATTGEHVPAVLTGAGGDVLAWVGDGPEPPPGATRLRGGSQTFRVRYAWDLLRVNELLVGALAEDRIEGQIAAGVHREGHLVLGPGSRLLPGVYIEGNVVIGRDCKIGPNAYLRGSTSIGDHVHVGQAVEVKNSILLARVGMGHLSYCGDSIVGEGANFGAGTITANFRHDGANHRSVVAGQLVDTGRRKLGAIIGDDVHTGIHTSIYPGRKIWPHAWTRPGTVVQRDLLPAAGDSGRSA